MAGSLHYIRVHSVHVMSNCIDVRWIYLNIGDEEEIVYDNWNVFTLCVYPIISGLVGKQTL